MALSQLELAKLTGRPPADVADKVNSVVLVTLAKLRTIFPDKPQLRMPDITYDLKGGVAGRAYGSHLIKLNLDYLLDERYTQDMLQDTIPHEIAHLACNLWWPSSIHGKAAHHGPKWQFVMVKLGLNPKRCHEYEVKPARRTNPTRYLFTCRCPNRIHKLSSNRFTRYRKGQNYACTVCGHQLEYTGATQ